MFVLKRLEDALKHRDRIYGLVAGIGLSNDIHGDLLAPSSEGQVRAMRMAYEQAGWGPGDVDLVECHAPGTPVGDAVEVEGLKSLWEGIDWSQHQCVIGSIKSNVGHTLTAAGAAGLLKVLLRSNIAGCLQPPISSGLAPTWAWRIARSEYSPSPSPGRPELPPNPDCAAISGFGFGGINAHVLIEGWGAVERLRGNLDCDSPLRSGGKGGWTPDSIHPGCDRGPFRDFRPIPRAASVSGACPGSQESRHAGCTAELVGRPPETAWYRRQGWGDDSFPGFYLDSLEFRVGQFRIPPKELGEMLPQQSLMLRVAAEAIRDAGWDARTRRFERAS